MERLTVWLNSLRTWRTQRCPERKQQDTHREMLWVSNTCLCIFLLYFICEKVKTDFFCPFPTSDQTIMEEASVLQTSAVEGSRTTLDESVMPPPSSQRGLKRKAQETEPALPVSTAVLLWSSVQNSPPSSMTDSNSSLMSGQYGSIRLSN